MMNRHIIMFTLAAATATVAAFPGTAQGAANFDLRKKVVGVAGIMNVVNTETQVSRGEFAKMLVKASPFRSVANSAGSTSVFADVPKDSQYGAYIRIAVEKGWMRGYLGGVFKPDQPVTLQEGVFGILALLGYGDGDFTGDQAGSRMAKYHFLKLDDQINKDQREVLSKEDCIDLFYNLLKTTPKDGSAIYGKLFGSELTSDGEINPLALADNGLRGPKLIKSVRRLAGYLPFKLDKANVLLNGSASNVSTLKVAIESNDYVLVYYHPLTKTLWAYTEDGEDAGRGVVRGTVSNIYYTSTNVMTPSAVSLEEGGKQYQLASSQMQFAFSMYGDIRIGDQIAIVYEKASQGDGEVYKVVDYIEE